MKAMKLTACAALMLASSGLWAAEPAECSNVRMGSVNWTDVIATSAMTQVVLQSLGYEVKQTTASQQIILGSMADNKLDTFLGYWQPTMQSVAKPYLDKKQIEVYSPAALGDAQSTFAVPRYAYDAGLKTFADIAKFKDKLGGKLYVIEPGSGANRITGEMIAQDRFGLKGFQLVESSEAGMLTAVKRAVSRKEWVVFFGWKPHPMNLQIDMAYLTGSQDAFGPNEGAATVSVMTAAGYDQRCPNVGKLLHNLSFSSDQVSAVMAPILERTAPEQAAKAWLKANPTALEPWLKGVTTRDGKDALPAVQAALK
ncbi:MULTISPECIES: choline ABC transporter substrate-binding protein [unclassified Pseudomonas]|uniref:choline ABC transporter substrate-binding protein n=1 Tax=unclassified Pseudomonas TaxID=196821 RepID=UPI000BDDB212|nr:MULTISPECIES: choline ABC transporter substrate-binding protein [unclassified Pseudomonas]PVZ11299.1 glycine betaine/proline transport system substrate-binding protein [Pseudomonas sp. URIL14HWK12:I12]PVZ22297.1 glycine betaine/proline transport system substrate-binding protein [Pseudomonas sp. URIL14HWK12:I10]PVZ31579.1 glycine betaine/proline transport system substrate-binding protein [Pseudomonas sp. URIL14HWK12:I11]SNZ16576.1 glycine betaine/proline transport system substrate-binding pro